MGHVLNQTSRFEVEECCLAIHELLLLRDRAGLPVHGLDDSYLPAKPLLSLCIRENQQGNWWRWLWCEAALQLDLVGSLDTICYRIFWCCPNFAILDSAAFCWRLSLSDYRFWARLNGN